MEKGTYDLQPKFVPKRGESNFATVSCTCPYSLKFPVATLAQLYCLNQVPKLLLSTLQLSRDPPFYALSTAFAHKLCRDLLFGPNK